MRTLADPKYRKIIGNAPNYIGTLLASDWIRCEVDTEGPATAWTEWLPKEKRFAVHFLEFVADMSPLAILTLWRHEVGHIVFQHFGKEFCLPDNPRRSLNEALLTSDIQVNTYLGDTETMMEISEATAQHFGVKSEGKTILVDPLEWLPKIGLNVDEYPYDVIHAYLHEWVDNQPNGEASSEGDVCGGIKGLEDGDGDSEQAEINSAVIGAVSSASDKTKGGERWGTSPGHIRIRTPEVELPDWLHAVESFARSIVEVILDERRKHSRPQEIYKAAGVHIPTYRPAWSYKPAQVCFLVDTSGSMLHELRFVSPVVEYLARHNIETRLITGDTRITFDGVVTSIPEITGGGGTDITPLFDRAVTYKPESIICFTDGYVPFWPTDNGIPTLWVGCKEKIPYGISA